MGGEHRHCSHTNNQREDETVQGTLHSWKRNSQLIGVWDGDSWHEGGTVSLLVTRHAGTPAGTDGKGRMRVGGG